MLRKGSLDIYKKCSRNITILCRKGIARRGDENGRDRARISTKIFFLSLEVPHVNEPVV